MVEYDARASNYQFSPTLRGAAVSKPLHVINVQA
jgi:hypothetical protein